jgi:hypothetical protein
VRLLDRWSRDAWWDWPLGAAAAVGYWLARKGGMDPVVILTGAGRSDMYQALVGVGGSVLAFAVVPAAIVLALIPGPRLRVLLTNHSGDLHGATIEGAAAALALMVFAVGGLALDSEASNGPVRHAVMATSVVLLSSVVRLAELFSILLRNVSRDSAGPPTADLPDLSHPRPSRGTRGQLVTPSRRERSSR